MSRPIIVPHLNSLSSEERHHIVVKKPDSSMLRFKNIIKDQSFGIAPGIQGELHHLGAVVILLLWETNHKIQRINLYCK